MKKIVLGLTLTAFIVSCNNSTNQHVKTLDNDDHKAGYSMGITMGQQVQQYSLSMGEDSLNYAEVQRGLMDFLNADKNKRDSYAIGQSLGQSIVTSLKSQKLEEKIEEKYIAQGVIDAMFNNELLFARDSAGLFLDEYFSTNMARLQEEANQSTMKELEKAQDYMDEIKSNNENVKETGSGLLYEVLKEGDGETPTDDSVVEVYYVGSTPDGNIFDQTREGQPAKFPLRGVIQGWQEGLKLMKTGAKYKFYIPSFLGYGTQGTPDGSIKPNENLVFEVELLGVEN